MMSKLPSFREFLTEDASTFTIKLPRKWYMYLIEFPETGMGYQRVDVEFQDRTVLNDVIVRNSEFLDLPLSAKGKQVRDIRVRPGKDLSNIRPVQQDVPISPAPGGEEKPINLGGTNIQTVSVPTPRG